MAALAILWVVLPWRLQAHYTPTDSAQTTAAGKRAESIKMAEPPSDCAKHVSQWLKDRWHIPLTENNRIVVFRTGQEKFDDLFAAVAQAKETIHMEYFNFRNDSISMALFSLLAERVKAGVKVRILFDGFGNSSNNRPLHERHLRLLREEGIEIYEFDPLRFPWVDKAMHRDHRKIVVIDGCVAYTGGMNVADYYIHGKEEFGEWRDIHARVEGDAVAELQGIFVRFWNEVTGQDLGGPDLYPGEARPDTLFKNVRPDLDPTAGRKCLAVVNRDPGMESNVIHDTFLEIINSAQHRLLIINPYFTLCGHIRRALKKAVKRGVDVQIMVSEKSDIPVTPNIVEYNTWKLAKKGAKVWVFQGGFHHSKIMMADDCCAFIGSANLNSRSLSFDYECNVFAADSATTAHLTDIFEQDKATRCYRLTPERRKALPPFRRFKGWLFHFLSPLVQQEQDNTNIPSNSIEHA